MPVTIVNGSQFGDEGKGKIVDMLAEHFDLGVRPTAGDNAGHTVVANGMTVKMRLTPSAIVVGIPVIIGDDVMINPFTLGKEIEDLRGVGVDVDHLLTISTNAHIVMPYHVYLDELNEAGTSPIGTTKRGIGPAYEDKVARKGIRMEEFVVLETLKERLLQSVEYANKRIHVFGGNKAFDAAVLYEQLSIVADSLRPFVGAAAQRIHKVLEQGGEVLLEGAQGSLNDLVYGTYPYVTSSRPIAGGLLAGAGIGPHHVQRVIGVVKPYQTRVGIGPVVGELFDAEAAAIVRNGNEYGTVTGRARRIMACDLVVLRHTIALNGTTAFALTKLDVLDTIPEIKLVTDYYIGGNRIDGYPTNLDLAQVEPKYLVLEGWNVPTSGVRRYEDLPRQAQALIETIEKLTKVPVGIVSVGADREATIVRKPELVLPARALAS